MNTADLRRVDLNLLVVFQVLCQEGNVTRAAVKLNLSQSAVSAALARLRALFDDQLFVRTRTGMTPTPTALSISSRIAPTLAALGGVLFEDLAFDPNRSNRVFHLAMSDDVEAVLAPWLIGEKLAQGWTVGFAIHQTSSTLWQDTIADRRINAAVCLTPQQQAAAFKSEPLLSGTYLCLFDQRRVRCSRPVTRQEYVAAHHVRVSFDLQRGWVDERMAQLGLSRRTACTISHFAGLATLLQSVPAIATIPEHAARAIAAATGLVTSPVPIETPRFSLSAVWSAIADGSSENVWLRGVLKRFAASV